MASVARSSPICRSSHILQHSRKPQTRSLSSSRTQCAQPAIATGNALRNMPQQQSMAARMKSLRRSEIPNDVGLIPNTYIRACGKMPSWFSTPLVRAQLEWHYFKQGAIDFGSSVYFNRWSGKKDPLTGRRKKIPMNYRERYTVARDLHRQLYDALATGDRNTINKIACSGLANQQIARLDRTRITDGNAPPASWTVKYRGWVLPSRLYFTIQSFVPSWFKSIHVLADRQVQLPVGQGILMRHVIVRVDSTQTLDKNDGSRPVTKKMREYVVLQRMIVEEEIGEWRIWGTVSPTDVDTALEIINTGKAESGTMMDRIRTMFPGMP